MTRRLTRMKPETTTRRSRRCKPKIRHWLCVVKGGFCYLAHCALYKQHAAASAYRATLPSGYYGKMAVQHTQGPSLIKQPQHNGLPGFQHGGAAAVFTTVGIPEATTGGVQLPWPTCRSAPPCAVVPRRGAKGKWQSKGCPEKHSGKKGRCAQRSRSKKTA